MNTSSSGIKKSALCRYFVASGTCFYGNDCQFAHVASSMLKDDSSLNESSPRNSVVPLSAQRLQDPLDHLGGHSSRLDAYLPYSQHNGILPESKLSTYISRPAGTSSSSRLDKVTKSLTSGIKEKLTMFSHSPNLTSNQLVASLSSLAIDSAPNPAASEFVPRANTPGGSGGSSSLSQTAAIPQFLEFESIAASPGFETIPFSSRIPQGVSSVSTSSTPLNSPRLTPQHSPPLKRRSNSPVSYSSADNFIPASVPTFQKNVDGTTYFYPANSSAPPATGNSRMVVPNFVMFPFTPAHISHMKPKANAPSFFMPDELRLEILHRHNLTMAQVEPEQYPDLPTEVDNYHNLFPLEPPTSNPLAKSSTFGYVTSVYRATNVKNGLAYCLRRIHGYRLVNPKAMTLVDMWKKLQHSNVVQLREVFTTKAFGDHCTVFVHDYHPGAETLMSKHFTQVQRINGLVPGIFHPDLGPRAYSQNKSGVCEPRQHAGLLPESLIWAYVVQLCSAMRTIHAAGLACRMLDPSKILITGKSRIRFNCCGIYDILDFDPNQSNPLAAMPHYQQEDLIMLGKVVLALACNSLGGIQRENLQASVELVARNYSSDLRNLILYLLTNQNRIRSVNDIMPMIGARFFTQLDAAHLRSDVLENELAKEVECGRLFRLISKLSTINERPELNLDVAWCETGDRYMLKLFRDYVFHQITEDGRPWIDMAHIVQCLNKLDAGVPEKVCLMSRDEQNILVVSYAELKHCLESAFDELIQATMERKVT